MKLFGRGRRRARTGSTFDVSSLDSPEATFMSRSSRTGGFEVARESDFQSGEEDTILDQSLYTNATYSSFMEKSTVISTATTIKQSSGKQQQQQQVHKQLQNRPILETRDIRPQLEMYQQNRQVGYKIEPTVVTPGSLSDQSIPEWGCAPQRKQRRERTSDVYDPESLQDLSLSRTASTTDRTTVEPLERISKIEPSTSTYRFEFATAAMDSIAKRKHRPAADEDENSSIYSFSFSETEEEIGFELDDPYPLVHRGSEDRDDESSSSGLSEGVAHSHVSDSDLLDGRSSPGTLRLTLEGLKQHEQKTFQQARRQPERHADEFEAWRKEHETRKWYNKKLKERELKLLEETQRMQMQQKVGGQLQQPSPPVPPPPLGAPTAVAASTALAAPTAVTAAPSRKHDQSKKKLALPSPFRPEEGVADLSLAPLASMQHLTLGRSDSSVTKRSFTLFRRRSRSTADEILERERELAREAKTLDEIRQKQERERFARKKQQYIEQQRAKEILRNGAVGRTSNSVNTIYRTTSTLSSTSTGTPALPHCVLCLEEVRTHIAIPCMHFSFCATCVANLEAENRRECPVCRQPNVSYASVAV